MNFGMSTIVTTAEGLHSFAELRTALIIDVWGGEEALP
jgi:hypothetical protein